jgi:hypothetical protein
LAQERNLPRSEAQFLRLFRRRNQNTPNWFVRVQSASLDWDIRGIDAFAVIAMPSERKTVKIPVQIASKKRNRRGQSYFERYPAYREAGVILILMKAADEENVQLSLFSALDTIRKQNIRFELFLQRTFLEEISGGRKGGRIGIERSSKSRKGLLNVD